MQTRITTLNTSDEHYQHACRLRYKVFFKPHGLPFEVIFDELEKHSLHYALFEAENFVAYARLTRYDSGQCQISQMLVLPEYARQGHGTALLQHIIKLVLETSPTTIFLLARVAYIEFYKKNNFVSEGDVFPSTKTRVPHIKMLYSG